jgi:hypothetical protein
MNRIASEQRHFVECLVLEIYGMAYGHLEIDRRIGAEEGGMSGAAAAFLRRAL